LKKIIILSLSFLLVSCNTTETVVRSNKNIKECGSIINSNQNYTSKILNKAKQLDGKSSKYIKNTSNGKLACAAMVNVVLNESIGKPVANNTYSTLEMYKYFEKSSDWKKVSLEQAPPGSIIISPTGRKIGHVGILGEHDEIYSNSSKRRKWDNHFDMNSWKFYYTNRRKLPTYAYVYDPI
jgi:hypothetical protein